MRIHEEWKTRGKQLTMLKYELAEMVHKESGVKEWNGPASFQRRQPRQPRRCQHMENTSWRQFTFISMICLA